jgi:hypothetical protein
MGSKSLSAKASAYWVFGYRPLLCVLLLIVFAGCGTATNEKNVGTTITVGGTVLPTQNPVQTPTLTGPERDATKQSILAGPESDNQTRVAYATNYALGTPDALVTPIIITMGPVLTPILGRNGDCAQGNDTFSYRGCWTDRVGDEYVFVATGAPWADLTQGAIRVYTSTLDLRTFGEAQWYETPTQSGEITVAEVIWPLLSVQTLDTPPTMFTFDLVARQWVSITVTPTPLITTLPLPSVSPFPTHFP